MPVFSWLPMAITMTSIVAAALSIILLAWKVSGIPEGSDRPAMGKTIQIDEDALIEAIAKEVFEVFEFTDLAVVAEVEGAEIGKKALLRLKTVCEEGEEGA